MRRIILILIPLCLAAMFAFVIISGPAPKKKEKAPPVEYADPKALTYPRLCGRKYDTCDIHFDIKDFPEKLKISYVIPRLHLLANSILPNAEFKKIGKALDFLPENCYAVLMVIDSTIDKDDNVTVEDIKSVASYSMNVERDEITLSYFEKDNGIFNRSKYSCEVPGVSMNHAYFMVDDKDYPLEKGSSLVLLADGETPKYKLKKKSDKFFISSGKLDKFIGERRPYFLAADSAKYYVLKKGKKIDDHFIEMELSDFPRYKYRMFLYGKLGAKYYYYADALGAYIGNTLPFGIKTDLLFMFSDLEEMLTAILNPVQNKNKVLISKEMAPKIISILMDLKSNYKDEKFNRIIDDVISDMKFFAGKTIGEIRGGAR